MRKYRKELGGACLCVIVEAVSELAIPLVMADIIDIGVANRDVHFILIRGAIMLGLALFALLLGVCYARLTAIGGQGFGAELRKMEYEKIQQFSFGNADHFSASGLLTRLTNDILIIQNAITNGLRPLVRSPMLMLVSLTFAFIINWRLAIIFLFTAPALAIILFGIIRSVSPLYHRMQKNMDTLNLVVQENLTAIQIVKAFVREDYETAKFLSASQEQRTTAEKAFAISSLNAPALQLAMYTTICCILWKGGNLYLGGLVTVGDLAGMLSYVLQILNSLMMLSNVFMLMTRSAASASRIIQVLDEKIEIRDESTQNLLITRGDIRFDHVWFKYNRDAAEFVLSDLCVHILPGQTVGVIGGTGSAKTSMVQLIPRLYEVTKGELLIDDQPVRAYSLKHLRDAVAFVLQKNTLFSGSIMDNLRWGNESANITKMRDVCRDAMINDFIETLPQGYETRLGAQGAGLSGGQRQRLCIARALLKNPKILILDDSTSAVDVATESEIQHNLSLHYAKMTKIIIAQRITSILHADQIVILEDGRINAIGTHQTLLAGNAIYQEIYHSQLEGALL